MSNEEFYHLPSIDRLVPLGLQELIGTGCYGLVLH